MVHTIGNVIIIQPEEKVHVHTYQDIKDNAVKEYNGVHKCKEMLVSNYTYQKVTLSHYIYFYHFFDKIQWKLIA